MEGRGLGQLLILGTPRGLRDPRSMEWREGVRVRKGTSRTDSRDSSFESEAQRSGLARRGGWGWGLGARFGALNADVHPGAWARGHLQ